MIVTTASTLLTWVSLAAKLRTGSIITILGPAIETVPGPVLDLSIYIVIISVHKIIAFSRLRGPTTTHPTGSSRLPDR